MATWDDAEQAAWNPEFDVRETGGAYVVVGDVPGLAAGDLEIAITGRRLRIAGARERDEPRAGGSYERASGGFARTFELPLAIDADRSRAALGDGVLEVTLPKRAGGRQTIDIAESATPAKDDAEAPSPFGSAPPVEPPVPSEMPPPKLA